MKPLAAAALATLIVSGWLARPAAADDRAKAAEHFSLAQKAEGRKDWQAAIDEYQAAYDASPHPSVLFNIATNYQRLGDNRTAADYFQRYLDESPDAGDRAQVDKLLKKLAAKPSRVNVVGRPAGARVIIDGERRGAAPLELQLPAGEHTFALDADGRRSQPQTVTLSYGDAVTVRLDLQVRPGVIMVYANVDGAEVTINGAVAGYTPYTGSVPAGKYQLVVSKVGYRSSQREVEVTPGGSRQVRVVLDHVGGEPPPPAESAKYLFGWSLGFDATGSGARYLLDLGLRSGSNRFELNVFLGSLGGAGGAGTGADGRIYVATGKVRPYLRAAIMAGKGSATGDDRLYLLEGGAGVLFSVPRKNPRIRYALDYFLEVDVHVRLDTPPMGQPRLGIPLVGGIVFRFGG